MGHHIHLMIVGILRSRYIYHLFYTWDHWELERNPWPIPVQLLNMSDSPVLFFKLLLQVFFSVNTVLNQGEVWVLLNEPPCWFWIEGSLLPQPALSNGLATREHCLDFRHLFMLESIGLYVSPGFLTSPSCRWSQVYPGSKKRSAPVPPGGRHAEDCEEQSPAPAPRDALLEPSGPAPGGGELGTWEEPGNVSLEGVLLQST